jgi:hypothetical protein
VGSGSPPSLEGDGLRKAGLSCFTVAVLYPLEVKRRLVTVDPAKGRAVKLAREIIQRRCYRPADLDTLTCTVEVTLFDLRPSADVAWVLEDGIKVFLTKSEQPLPFEWSWPWRASDAPPGLR